MCAEAIALGRAVTEYGSSDIDTIVAVYHRADGSNVVVSPRGICGEMISDYAPDATVLMPEPNGAVVLTPIAALLPGKYARG